MGAPSELAALLVIDMQNGFLHPDGSIPRNDKPMLEVERVVAETVDLVAAARDAGLPVIYTAHVFRPDYVDVPSRMRVRDMFNQDDETLVKGSWDAAIADELKPLEMDPVVEKNRYDAFLYTELELILRALGVGRLLVCGVATNVCVESTVRSARSSATSRSPWPRTARAAQPSTTTPPWPPWPISLPTWCPGGPDCSQWRDFEPTMTVALIVVDVQNDFTDGGPFSLTGNDAIARRIGAYVAEHRHHYDLVLTTQDWHIEPGDHFDKHPVHCVADTLGAALDPELDRGAGTGFTDLVDRHLYKGQFGDDYSGFLAVDGAGVRLPSLLEQAGVERIDVCGFAEDGCVAATVRDGAWRRLPGLPPGRPVRGVQPVQRRSRRGRARGRRSRDHAGPGLSSVDRADRLGRQAGPGASTTVRL